MTALFRLAMLPVFLLDPDGPGETEKPGEVIRGSDGWKSPSGVQWQSPWWVRGKAPENES